MGSKKEEKRNALLRSALELFAEKGFDGSSTALIAKQAGVASGTLFFHFNSKEELIHELFKEIREKINKEVLNNFPENMSVQERLLGILSNLLSYFLKYPAEFKFVEQYHFSPLSKWGGSLSEENNLIRNLLLLGREKKIIKDAPLLSLEAVAFGPITALIKEYVNRGTPIDDEVAKLTIEACWDGLKR
jgi:AcrR family transcriptional regulator